MKPMKPFLEVKHKTYACTSAILYLSAFSVSVSGSGGLHVAKLVLCVSHQHSGGCEIISEL